MRQEALERAPKMTTISRQRLRGAIVLLFLLVLWVWWKYLRIYL